MKFLRPLKYVITAAAVCILCFSGNGEYLYAVLALTTENDIVNQPEQLDDISMGKYSRKSIENGKDTLDKSCLRKYNALYYSNIIYQQDLSYENNLCSYYILPLNISWQSCPVSLNEVLYELFAVRLHGNRSP